MQKSLTLFLALGLSACQTVANAAQNVADSTRSGQQPSTERNAVQSQSAADATSLQSNSDRNRSSGPRRPCSENFVATGSFFTGKQFKSHAPVTKINPDNVYRKAYAEIVKHGWQIVSADKEVRVISANQQANFGNSIAVPLNVVVNDDGKRGSIVSFTFSAGAGMITKEDILRDGFCQFVEEIMR